MIKLIATDLDGTLLHSNGYLDREIYDIIEKLKEMGIRFVAASGRQLMSIKKRFIPVDDDVIYIAENGGYVKYRNEEIYLNAMGGSIVGEIIDAAAQLKDTSLFLCGKTYAYTDKPELIDFMRKPEFGYEIKLVDNLRLIDEDIFKIGLFDTMDPRDSSMKVMLPLFKGRVHMTMSGYNSLDFLGIDVNKGAALKHICDRFGVKKEETVAFGDNYNDLEMFDSVGISFAMLNADEYVKSRAKYVIGSNDENSVVKTLKDIIKEIR
ncbi:5-amino-6-(5-phospho-D-ribitylamino)uracil phosphatase YbjI [Clostridiales bacterium]|nr:5-amino-6-(5-phospho-D-ribitylamino)uracil phosphatase YbjI [Clostridiales bacterium]